MLSKMPFEDLLDLGDDIDERLASDRIDAGEAALEWDELLSASGWTEREFEDQIDRRWDYIDTLRVTPPKRTSKAN